ncbi:MAG: HAMP domain-containing histidine kinase, partial [Desulfuromonadales bacterium]|nr:HAMP domain-containing histidine kinase [Desulfuromonadales bacterium]
MNLFRRLFHPFITFIGIQIVWIALLVFWIYWFLGRHQQLKELAQTYQTELLPQTGDWLILTEGILLLVAILIGIYVIFLYWRRQASLNRAQTNFINQVTHELKSPLASIQLHLETIQLRQPNAEKLQEFIQRMQLDSDRLDGLINNLLTANKIEHKATRLNLQRADLSQAITNWIERERAGFPEEGTLNWEIEPNLIANIEADALETVLRNLLENAILYAVDVPIVKIGLRQDGEMAHLQFSD